MPLVEKASPIKSMQTVFYIVREICLCALCFLKNSQLTFLRDYCHPRGLLSTDTGPSDVEFLEPLTLTSLS